LEQAFDGEKGFLKMLMGIGMVVLRKEGKGSL